MGFFIIANTATITITLPHLMSPSTRGEYKEEHKQAQDDMLLGQIGKM